MIYLGNILEILFEFKSKQLIKIIGTVNQSIEYILIDSTQIFITKNITYISHYTNKEVDINAYKNLAKQLNIQIFLYNTKINSLYIMGNGYYKFLQNEKVTHLIENVFIIKKLINKTIKDVYIYSNIASNQSINIIDLRDFKELYLSLNINKNNDIINISMLNNTKKIGNMYLINFMKNQCYSNIEIYLSNQPIKIKQINSENFVLKPESLILNITQSIVVLTNNDIEFDNEIIITKNLSQNFIFSKENDNLILTNAFNTTKVNELFTIIFSNFYKFMNKMLTLTIKFNDIKFILKNYTNEIVNATDFNLLTNQIQWNSYKKLT